MSVCTLRERPSDIYGGGGPEELAKKKFASDILSKKNFVSDQYFILKNHV